MGNFISELFVYPEEEELPRDELEQPAKRRKRNDKDDDDEPEHLHDVMPVFDYCEDALAVGAVVEAKRRFRCAACGHLERRFRYAGPIYTETPPNTGESICAWCIATGLAAKKFKAEFVEDVDVALAADSERRAQLVRHTPSPPTASSFIWPACCNDFCKLLVSLDNDNPDELTFKCRSKKCKKKAIKIDTSD